MAKTASFLNFFRNAKNSPIATSAVETWRNTTTVATDTYLSASMLNTMGTTNAMATPKNCLPPLAQLKLL